MASEAEGESDKRDGISAEAVIRKIDPKTGRLLGTIAAPVNGGHFLWGEPEAAEG